MKKGMIVVGTLLLAAAGAGGYWYYTENFSKPEENVVYVSSVSDLTTTNSGYINRYAGVVEAQETVQIKIESGRKVREVSVKTGDVVKRGQLLFEYDLSSIEQSLKEANLDLDKLKNEAASLQNQITTLEKEKKKASQDSQLSYTIEIETAKMNLKKNEYDQVSKQSEITQLQGATGNTEVRSEIDGIIQKIDNSQLSSGDDEGIQDSLDESYYDYSGYGDSSDNNAFITILSTGEYRVKGSVNELNINYLMEGEPMIIRSRADETQTWTGVIGIIDRENANSSNNNGNYWGMTDASDSETNSSTYPFYVELDSSDDLMLGQHVYIEPDNGQMLVKDGVWLSEVYIEGVDTSEPYVWATDGKKHLEKRTVVLGQYDENLGEFEILSGLSEDDYVAYPESGLEEGFPTTTNEDEVTYGFSDEEWESEEWESEDWGEESWDEDLESYEGDWDQVEYEGDWSEDSFEGDWSTEEIEDWDELPDEESADWEETMDDFSFENEISEEEWEAFDEVDEVEPMESMDELDFDDGSFDMIGVEEDE